MERAAKRRTIPPEQNAKPAGIIRLLITRLTAVELHLRRPEFTLEDSRRK